jgi:hypothetical protein
MQATTLSRIVVRALVGPRTVYSANNRTTWLLIDALSEPGVRSSMPLVLAIASLRSHLPLVKSRAQSRGKR